MHTRHVERLIIVLGDQLNRNSAALKALDPRRDAVWMAEVTEEATHVWSHKARITLFIAAMRHFRDQLLKQGLPLTYHTLHESDDTSLAGSLEKDLQRLQPGEIVMAEVGDYRVQAAIERVVERAGSLLTALPDQHFLCGLEDFNTWAEGRKQLRLEHFYRYMRKRTGVLMEGDDPVGGRWNFDAENRGSFGRNGPESLPLPRRFKPDSITRATLAVDAVEWVELPNTMGMSQYADGGVMASKPYVASGRYISKMSNYCSTCRYDPTKSTGEKACPFTTLYWDFLIQHEARFARHPRAAYQWRNLARLNTQKRYEIQEQAAGVRQRLISVSGSDAPVAARRKPGR